MIDKFILVINEQQVINEVFCVVLHQKLSYEYSSRQCVSIKIYIVIYSFRGKKYHFLNWQPFNPFLLEI